MPRTPRNSDRLEDWAYPLAERLARSSIGGWPDPSVSVEDLVQIMVEHWWLMRSRFTADGPAALKTVAFTVMTNRLRDEFERATTLKRGAGRGTLSLSTPINSEDEDTDQLGDLIAGEEDTFEAAAGTVRHQAIEAFLRNLGDADRELLDHLRDDPRVRPVARRLGVHHSQVYRRIDRIRRRAEDAGLQDWL